MIADPVVRDYVVPQGADYPIRMRYVVNDVPVDLTGATIRGALKKNHTSTTASLSCTIANGKAFLNTATGVFGITLIAADTSALEATSYVYDIEVVLPSGDVTRAMQGKITLTPEVTV